MFKIEKNVPVSTRCKYPLPDMEIGDSFFVGADYCRRARTRAFSYGKKHNKKFIARKEGNGVRIWRVE